MNKLVLALAVPALLLAGCGDSQQAGGGIETSDFQARVLAPSGCPAAGARVWLVRSGGDSAPAAAIDSAVTDSDGYARLTGPTSGHALLGLDASFADWLAMAPHGLGSTASATVRLASTGEVSAQADSAGMLPRLFVPGSHFLSRPGGNGTQAILRIPQGTWDVAVAQTSGVVLWRLLSVGSLPVALATTPLPAGPDLSLDSFQVDGIRMFRDTTLAPAWSWQKDSSVLDTFRFFPALVRQDTGITTFLAGPDSSFPYPASRAVSATLPATGTIGLSFKFASTPRMDTGMARILSLVDSSGSGAALQLDWSTQPGSTSIVYATGNAASDTAAAISATRDPVAATSWYITWTPASISVRSSDGLVGSVHVSGGFGRPKLSIELRNTRLGNSSVVQVSQVRLYKPK